MYKDHNNHIRGDEVAGKGFGYECLWRSRLLLWLGSADTLTVYLHEEDACISKDDGQKTYYQIKHTIRPWTPSVVKKILNNPCQELDNHSDASYVFCTNAQFSLKAEEAFRQIKEKYGDRLKRMIWETDPEDPVDKIRNDICRLIKTHFQPRNISAVLSIDRVTDCCNKLLALEAQFKLREKTSINREQVWAGTGLKQLIEEIPSLIFGERLFTWPSWVEKAKTQDTDAILSATRKISLGLDGISMDLEKEVVKFAQNWGYNPSESFLYLISGASGTGKTWLLLRLGKCLSTQFPVFWADEFATGRDPKLSEVSSWENNPTIVLIDNLIEAEWSGLIAGALRSQPPILIIGTTSRPLHDKQMLYLQQCLRNKLVHKELGPLMNGEEVTRLVNKIRNGVVSGQEQDQLRFTNIRYAVKLLEGRDSQAALVDRVYSLWRLNDSQSWVMPLIFCSSLGVKLPRSLLREHARLVPTAARELPDDIWPIILRMRRDEDELLWLEDPVVAQSVLKKIKSEVDTTTLEMLLLETAIKLIGTGNRSVNVESAFHRQFARRIVSEFCNVYPRHQEQLLESCKNKIMQLLANETRWALAYVWLPFFPPLERAREARKAAQEFLSKAPQSAADVALLVEAFGDEHASKIIRLELPSAHKWDIQPWVMFIEHLRPLNCQSKRDLLRLSIPLLQISPISISGLVDTRNIAVDLLTLIEEFGQPEHREWYLNVLNGILPESPTEETLKRQYIIPQYFRLVSRCIMQPRNGLSIQIINKLFFGDFQNTRALNQLYAETYDNYKTLYYNEVQNSYHIMALKRGHNYAIAETTPTKVNSLWNAVLDFADRWATLEERCQIENLVYSFFDRVLEKKLPPKLFEALLLQCARLLVRKNGVSREKLKVLFKLLQRSSVTHAAFQLFLLLTACVASQDIAKNDLVKHSKTIFTKLVLSEDDEVMKLSTSFLKKLGKYLRIRVNKPIELALLFETYESQNQIIIDLMYCIGNIPWDDINRQHIAEAIYNRWHGNDVVRWHLLLSLLKLNAAPQAKATVETLIETQPDDPDILLFASTWESRYGDPKIAQDHIMKALRIYLQKTEGGHPQQTSRAYVALARHLDSPRREILELCAVLTSLDSHVPILG